MKCNKEHQEPESKTKKAGIRTCMKGRIQARCTPEARPPLVSKPEPAVRVAEETLCNPGASNGRRGEKQGNEIMTSKSCRPIRTDEETITKKPGEMQEKQS